MALEVVSERGKADYVVGRYDAADAAERRTFEVFQLDTEREAAHRALVEILPEADLLSKDVPSLRGSAPSTRYGLC